MIELVFMILAVSWFVSSAKKKKKNKLIWGLTALFSYYIPALVFGVLIYPIVVTGWITKSNEFYFQILGVGLSILVGIIGLLISKRFLEKELLSLKVKRTYLISIIISALILVLSLASLTLGKVISGVSIPGLENASGLTKLKRGDLNGALLEFNKAIERQPNKSTLYYNRAQTYGDLRNFEKAIIDYKKALTVNNFKKEEKKIDALTEMGTCYFDTKDFNNAIKSYKKALNITPNSSLLKLNVAFFFDHINEVDSSCFYLNQIKSVEPKFEASFLSLKQKCK
jgi:tetratricopeptide (TPR) repeat protein